MGFLLLLLKMSFEDWHTKHIDMRDLVLLLCLNFSIIFLCCIPFLWILKKHTNVADIILLAILCSFAQVDIFLFLTGIIGLATHSVLRKAQIPYVPIMTTAFYLEKLIR